MGGAYYNEIDRDAVRVLRALIADGVIAPGDVDDRSIKDVSPDDLRGYTQCHFFAGGGLWSVAARLAGWPDERPLWTASCPCQPFSVVGQRGGADDPRHLWPDLFRLVRDTSEAGHGPPVLMGEQVSRKAGQHWFDGVASDLASIRFTSRSRDIPACAVDAPHERNRLYWIAVAEPDGLGREWRQGSEARCLVNRKDAGRDQGDGASSRYDQRLRNGSWWAGAERIECQDGKARRTEPSIPLLADGVPERVGIWRIAGNAISPVLAAEVIGAFLDAELLEDA